MLCQSFHAAPTKLHQPNFRRLFSWPPHIPRCIDINLCNKVATEATVSKMPKVHCYAKYNRSKSKSACTGQNTLHWA